MLCPNCHSQTENYCVGNTDLNKNYCKDCGKEISRKAVYCTACYNKHHHKVERPSKEKLIDDYIKIQSFSGLGKFYNVNEKTVTRWFVYYGLPGKAKELK